MTMEVVIICILICFALNLLVGGFIFEFILKEFWLLVVLGHKLGKHIYMKLKEYQAFRPVLNYNECIYL
jgi:hypothetical protein